MAPIGPKRAIIATACKMPCIIQVTLRDDKLYRAPGVDYEQLPVERNASRWLRKFKEYGFLEEEPARYRRR